MMLLEVAPLLDPSIMALIFTELMFSGILLAIQVLLFVFGLVFGIVWLVWRKRPGKHRGALIATGVLLVVFTVVGMLASGLLAGGAFVGWGLLTCWGLVPAILAIVGGAIAPTSRGA